LHIVNEYRERLFLRHRGDQFLKRDGAVSQGIAPRVARRRRSEARGKRRIEGDERAGRCR
jgi:hypothetical protein